MATPRLCGRVRATHSLILSDFQTSLFLLASRKSCLDVNGPNWTWSEGLGERRSPLQRGTK